MQSKKNIRWALLGAGNIAHSFTQDFALMQNAELVAVAARDKEKAKLFAQQYNIPLSFSYDELYDSKEIDAVYISTTHNFHFEQTLKCLQNTKAVLCEKPITVSDAAFKQLAAASKENNVFLMEAMWTYFLPAIQKAKQWMQEGRIGKLKVIQADFSYPAEKNMEGRLYNPHLAGGALLDIGVYPIALAYYFADKSPSKISAFANKAITGVDEQVGILFEYDDMIANLFSSISIRSTNSARIFGEEGYIEIPYFWKTSNSKLFDKDYNLLDEFSDNRTSHGFIYEMQHANDMILEDKIESPVMPHARSNDIQEAMMEIRKQVGLKYPFE